MSSRRVSRSELHQIGSVVLTESISLSPSMMQHKFRTASSFGYLPFSTGFGIDHQMAEWITVIDELFATQGI